MRNGRETPVTDSLFPTMDEAGHPRRGIDYRADVEATAVRITAPGGEVVAHSEIENTADDVQERHRAIQNTIHGLGFSPTAEWRGLTTFPVIYWRGIQTYQGGNR